MEKNNNLYEIKNLNFSYRLGKQFVKALDGINLEIEKKAFMCLAGPSGSGKTTLLSILGLIEPVQEGAVFFETRNFFDLKEEQKNFIRRFKIGFIFQDYLLFDVLSVQENVEFFLTRQGVDKKSRKERVEEALTSVGIWEHRQKRPNEISGGQRQRVAIARAFAKKPEVIIADEPTASLDQKTGREIMEILMSLNEKKGASIIMASHDHMVFEYAKTKLNLKDGQIC